MTRIGAFVGFAWLALGLNFSLLAQEAAPEPSGDSETPAEASPQQGQNESTPPVPSAAGQDSSPHQETPAPAQPNVTGEPGLKSDAVPSVAEPVGQTTEPAATGSAPSKLRARGVGDEKVMGTWRFGFGGGRTEFDEKYNHIEKLYDSNRKTMPQGFVDYYLWDWYATLGISFRASYLKANGKAAKITGAAVPYEKNIEDSEIDPDSHMELTLIPLQLAGVLQMTPFAKRWIGIAGWMGVERQFVQEVRFPPEDNSNDSGTASDKPETRVNRGWNHGGVVGAGLNLRIDRIEPRSVASLRFMGIRAIYLMPYFEKVVLTKDKNGPFNRTTIGAMFTFESIR